MIAAPPISPLDAVAIQLRPHGMVISTVPGGFCVNDRYGTAATVYQTDDLSGALRVGLALPPALYREPPLGPMGRKDRRRARMYAYNRLIAAKRRVATMTAKADDCS